MPRRENGKRFEKTWATMRRLHVLRVCDGHTIGYKLSHIVHFPLRLVPLPSVAAGCFHPLDIAQFIGAEVLSLANTDENKVFGITFRTTPSDSTGIPHILEHSVLCGSRKYPVKVCAWGPAVLRNRDPSARDPGSVVGSGGRRLLGTCRGPRPPSPLEMFSITR